MVFFITSNGRISTRSDRGGAGWQPAGSLRPIVNRPYLRCSKSCQRATDIRRKATSPMPLSFPTSGILHLLWGGQSCPQPAFSRLFGPSCAPKESAESRLQPRLAAPRLFRQLQEKLSGIGLAACRPIVNRTPWDEAKDARGRLPIGRM